MTPAPQPRESLATADPAGRFDVMLYRLTQMFIKRAEPHLHNLPLWDKGVGEIVEAGIHELGIPATRFTPVDIARAIGILPRQVVANTGKRRRR